MFLATAVDQIEMESDLDSTTIGLYFRAVKRFSDFIGKPAEDSDLKHENLNKFIQYIQSVRSNTTAGNYRRGLCRVWNYLTENYGLDAYQLRRLRRPKMVYKPVTAWSVKEIALIFEAAAELNGNLKIGVPANKFFTALLWTAYDTGLRPSDLFRLKWEQVDTTLLCVPLIQNKTQKPHVVFFSNDAMAALNEIRTPSRELVFPVTWGCIRKWMDKLFAIAATKGFKRVKGKNIGTLRKSNATQIYIEHGEAAAAESLGHTSGTRVARNHYIDHRASRQYSVPINPYGNTKGH